MENSRLYIEQSEVCRSFSALEGIKDFITRTNEHINRVNLNQEMTNELLINKLNS